MNTKKGGTSYILGKILENLWGVSRYIGKTGFTNNNHLVLLHHSSFQYLIELSHSLYCLPLLDSLPRRRSSLVVFIGCQSPRKMGRHPMALGNTRRIYGEYLVVIGSRRLPTTTPLVIYNYFSFHNLIDLSNPLYCRPLLGGLLRRRVFPEGVFPRGGLSPPC